MLGGLALRLALIWSGVCDGKIIADDAYYYFTIGHNLAAGVGPTFDRLSATNGFHPLYQALLVPIFAVARLAPGDPWLPIHGALSACVLFDTWTALLIAVLLRRAGHRLGGVIAAWFWSLGPPAVFLSLRGLEGSISAWAVTLALLMATERDASGAPSRGARLGFALGLAFLARTDNGPLLALSLAVLLATDPFLRQWARSNPGAAWGWTGEAGVTALLVASPWLAWNLATFGTVVQVSGLAKAHNHAIFGALPALGGVGTVQALAERIAAPLLLTSQYLAGEDQAVPRLTPIVLWLAILGLTFVLLLARRTWIQPERRMDRPILAFAASFVIAHILLYGFLLGTYAVWYATVPALLGTLIAGGIAAERIAASSSLWGRRIWVAVLFALALIGSSNFLVRMGATPRERERESTFVLGTLRRTFPAARTIGGFNVGALGYFATVGSSLRVTNLDGLVNNALYRSWREGRALRWLVTNVDLLLMDAPETMRGWLDEREWSELIRVFPSWKGSIVHGPRRDQALPVQDR